MRLLPLATLMLLATATAQAEPAPAPIGPALPPPEMAEPSPAPPVLVAHQDASLDMALLGPWRSDANKARDRYRHPKQTLAFFGVNPGQTVIEIWPGGGWYAEILAPMLRLSGEYVAVVPKAMPDSPPRVARNNDALRAMFAAKPEVFGTPEVREAIDSAPVLGPPESADVVLTFRNAHNWVMAGNEQAMFKAIFEVLKPGGTLGLTDHRAAADQPPAEMKSSGYLPEHYVIALAEGAGFELVGKSEINANPADTKDYPNGVWTLPPTLNPGDKDRAKYLAIGESDRMTLKFRKPE